MVLSATFNNISAISWRAVLLVQETECTEKTTDLPQVTEKLYHIINLIQNLQNFGSFVFAFSEKNILEIDHPETRIAYGSHVCQWIRTNE
jgi:hypothetical protein